MAQNYGASSKPKPPKKKGKASVKPKMGKK